MASAPLTQAYIQGYTNVAVMYTSLGETVAAAPTNYGTDFQLTAGTDLRQVQVRFEDDCIEHLSSEHKYYRVRVTIILHHLRTNLADEVAFTNATLDAAHNFFFPPSIWRAGAHCYDVADTTGDPESSEIEREGNVLSWTFSITLLMDDL